MTGFKKKKRKGKQHVISKKTIIDGILFQSKLEGTCYKKLKEAGIPSIYEGKKFILMNPFTTISDSWEFKYGKFKPKLKGSSIAQMAYTPDFTCPNMKWVIEVKGRANESFPLRWKLFKNHLRETKQSPVLFMPTKGGDIDMTIAEILKLIKSSE